LFFDPVIEDIAMGTNIELAAGDGHRLSAYMAEPAGKPRGGIVVIQEIFGVTRHIRDVAEQYAAAGFLAIAPALFDRLEPGVDVPYDQVARGFGYMQAMQNDLVMLDLQAALDRAASAGPLGVVGFCWGGTLAFLAAARLEIDAAVSYYGGGIPQYLAAKPRCPVMYHFGELDTHIPLSTVKEIEAAHPEGVFYLYPAGHGFNCTDRSAFEPTSARRAFERTVEFFHEHVG
jgi:carboxymethylenebutenolidase